MSAQVKRVVVGVDGSPGSIAALKQAALEAVRHQAELCPVLAWSPPGGESQYTLYPAPRHVHQQWESDARNRLVEACDVALDDAESSVKVSLRVVRAQPGAALVAYSSEPTDLLVVGVGSHGPLHHMLGQSTRRHCLRHARCSVLVVNTDADCREPVNTDAECPEPDHLPSAARSGTRSRPSSSVALIAPGIPPVGRHHS